MNRNRTIIEPPKGESELVKFLVLVFALCSLTGASLFYGGYWFGFIMLILGFVGMVILEIGGWRK